MQYQQFKHCGLNVALNMLSGKWKPIILYHLFHQQEMRFTELWRIIPKVAKKVLLEHLKQMEAHELIIREEKHTFPPEVYYRLSERGKALGPALSALELWANEYAADEVTELKQRKKVTA
ncbi:HxlR family transcriptional regulator [Mucilaginibacter frigoritolerans]|jgi:DNA-binding HxlR family transcriptional regulator|uniref:HxlR family transcriptional regulator n=1 Tax=Mucilaginibacter frigoritolerans TaxID=652788 RepID=A0A562TP51_9SPHI|nr:helix-turn-helix domain-containing protein [Mucilaginibacter frigoritolerans]TWI94610.1 HxlR family transcriptional regulator [Mucilaginibacter frigoritolerans]